ncbi:hypothetical protein INT43_002111 [Umbelopsis isabellina]|uniref:UVR domain-containing protein n=1 Tax=Mortierella isabellina TaxID=91625 RepID=A0A8H7PSG6_MORIS|nr:hypothetical protein INT43_002111 [Umbelopsis isabellina]
MQSDDFYEENEQPRRVQPTSRTNSQVSSPSRGGFLSGFSFLRDGFANGSSSAGHSIPSSPRGQSPRPKVSTSIDFRSTNTSSESRSPSQSAFAFIAAGSPKSHDISQKRESGNNLSKVQMRSSQFSFIEADLATPSSELAFAIDSRTNSPSKKRSSLPMAPPSASVATSDPSNLPKVTPKPHDYERQKVSSESALKRIQAETNRRITMLSNVFGKQAKTYSQLEQLYGALRSLESKEQQCLDDEDFVRADSLHTEWEKTTKHIEFLESQSLKGLSDEFSNTWHNLSNLMRQEAEAASKAAEAYVAVKSTREQGLEQYVTDTNNVQRQKIQEIMEQRTELEKEKSENAFDYEMWEKAEAEYAEKVDDLVHEEKKERESWQDRKQDIENEIEELLQKVNALKKSREECVNTIRHLDDTIDKAIAVHEPEKEALNSELELVVKRKADIDTRAAEIDEQERKIQQLQERHDKDIRRQESELAMLNQSISEARERANVGHEDADEIDRIMRTLISDFEVQLEPKLDELVSRQHDTDEQRARVDSLSARLITTKSKMQRLSKDIMIVESQLPELEEQKTTAVGGRDFKTAAKTSSKIKSLKSALEQSIIQRKTLQDTVTNAEAELKEARQQLSDMIQERKEAERTIGEDILQSIQQCRQNLIIARERLAENQYRVHSLLRSEITSLENRIKYITMKFEISPDLIGELQRHSSKSSLRSVGRSFSKEGEQSTATLDELESLLKKAVAEENYEEADLLQQQIEELDKFKYDQLSHTSPSLI